VPCIIVQLIHTHAQWGGFGGGEFLKAIPLKFWKRDPLPLEIWPAQRENFFVIIFKNILGKNANFGSVFEADFGNSCDYHKSVIKIWKILKNFMTPIINLLQGSFSWLINWQLELISLINARTTKIIKTMNSMEILSLKMLLWYSKVVIAHYYRLWK